MMISLMLLALLSFPATPDSTTPGDLCTVNDQDFHELRYEEQIPYCQRNVSDSLKDQIYEDYGIPDAEHSQYTIDHLIPLFAGGSNARENLWPQHTTLSTAQTEYQVYLQLRDGKIHQQQAIDYLLCIKFKKENCSL